MTECESCGGSGLVNATRCRACNGGGYTPLGEVSWEPEGNHDWDPTDTTGCVAPPRSRPQAIVIDADNTMEPGRSYSFRIEWEGYELSYQGAPVEEHDCIPKKFVVRLDRTMRLYARRL